MSTTLRGPGPLREVVGRLLLISGLMGIASPYWCAGALAQATLREEVQEEDGSVGVYIRFAESPEQTVKPYGYFKANARWPAEANGRTIIFVCWENPSPQFEADMALSRESVEQSWQLHSLIEFRGWQKCAAQNAGIRISIQDVGPAVWGGLGREIDGRAGAMVLNFTLSKWGSVCRTSPEIRRNCLRMLAVHEFGHAIGFAHEQNRPDKPGECTEPKQGPNGTVLLTPYDPESVMNYCNYQNYDNGGRLSALDIKALQKIYGAPQ